MHLTNSKGDVIMSIEPVSKLTKKRSKKIAKKIKKDIKKEALISPNGVCIIYYYAEDGGMDRVKSKYIVDNIRDFERLGYLVDVERDFWDSEIKQVTLRWEVK